MMEKLVRESEYFVAWLVFWLCRTVGGFILGVIAGAIVGASLGVAGVSLQSVKIICTAVGFVLSIPLSYLLFRFFVGEMIVKKVERRIASMRRELPHQSPGTIIL